MQVIVDQLVVNYKLSGKGKLVLLLHGWGDTYRTFTSLETKLSPKFRVLSFDLPGFGESQAPHEAWNLDNYALFVKHLLAKLELGRPYVIIGHSNGGALAIRSISLSILRPEKLVLLASSGIRNNNQAKKKIMKMMAKGGRATTFWLPLDQKQKLQKKFYGTIGSDYLVVPELKETYKLTVKQDVQIDARKIKLPVLLVFADHDPAIPIEDARTYNKLMVNSRLEIIDSSDHFIHHDKKDQVEDLIMEFIS